MQRSQFGPYRVTRLLGQGGMGAVYEAIDPATGRIVAVKTLPLHLAHDDGIRRRFQGEIDTLMNLRHPGIARMIGSGEEEGLPFFVMEFVPGRTLDELLKSGRRFTPQETIAIVQEILPILKYAHDQGVVHRDLKPANLMFPPAAGGGFHVKLTDFGIAKLYGETGLTRPGLLVGTPEYMAPEQATGAVVDHRADLYCLGLVMHAMLAGEPPFRGSLTEVIESQKSRRPPRLSTLAADVPPALDDLVDALLAKPVDGRPANAAAVARALGAIASREQPPAARGGGGTRVAGGEPPASAPDLPPTLAMTPAAADGNNRRRASPHGGVPTVADDATHAGSPDRSRYDQTEADGSRSRRSTYTTVEAQRAQKRRTDSQSAWGSTAGGAAVLLLAAVAGYAAWAYLVVPNLWPSSDVVFQDILDTLSNPGEREASCRKIRGFLASHSGAANADQVRQLGREEALRRLHQLSRKRMPTYSPASKRKEPFKAEKVKAESRYLEAIRLSDRREAADKLRELVTNTLDRHDPDNEAAVAMNPCAIVENPDEATWRELAQRQLDIVEGILRQEDAAEKREARSARNEARAMLRRAEALKQEAETTANPARRVMAITRRFELLDELVEKFQDDPAVTDEVVAAKKLLEQP